MIIFNKQIFKHNLTIKFKIKVLKSLWFYCKYTTFAQTKKFSMDKRIKEILKVKGQNLGDLANNLGMTRVNLSYHLHRNPSLAILTRIADALDVPIWQLFVTPEEVVAQQREQEQPDGLQATCPHCGKPINVVLTK